MLKLYMGDIWDLLGECSTKRRSEEWRIQIKVDHRLVIVEEV